MNISRDTKEAAVWTITGVSAFAIGTALRPRGTLATVGIVVGAISAVFLIKRFTSDLILEKTIAQAVNAFTTDEDTVPVE